MSRLVEANETSTIGLIAQLSRQLFDDTAGMAKIEFADSLADLVRPRSLRRLDCSLDRPRPTSALARSGGAFTHPNLAD